MRAQYWKMPVCGAIAVALAGCGGGGGSSDTGPAPSTKLHIYAAGDQWQYDITGQETLGGENLAVTGTETRAVSNATVDGRNVLAMTITDNLVVNNQTANEQTTNYYTQDPTTGDLTLVGDTQGPGNTLRTVTADQVTQKGTFVSGSTQQTSITYSNGDTQTSTQTIAGHMVLTVPAGQFNTWQMTNTKTDTNGISSTDTEFWAPNLGNFVKAGVNGTEPGFTIRFTLTMTSTNVQPSS